MILTPWLPTVRKIKDGEPVDQATVNVPIDQLTQREQHLYEKFEELSGKSVLIAFGQRLYPELENPIQVGEMSIVFYKKDANGEGLAKGVTGFSSSSSSSMFSPNNSNYSFGLLKSVYPVSKTADVYIEGLCELSKDIDDPVYGLLQSQTGTPEAFSVGPYYLSNRSPGKITRDPSGIPVYIGYAISKRRFLLHTNVDEFSQFFINYRYHVLDRVAGIPSKNLSNIWSISSPDTTKLGWIPASSAGVATPEGAKFYYNIPKPSSLLLDTGLDSYLINEGEDDEETVHFERDEAAELAKYLPPLPANFIQLYINGTLLRYRDIFDVDGDYSLNEYGLWWHKDTDGNQPWSSSYPASAPSLWASQIKNTIESTRKNIFVSFSKFNPALRTQLVSSLTPFNSPANVATNTPANRATNFIKFYSKDNPTQTGVAGDLLVDIIAPVNEVGKENDAFASLSDYPASFIENYTANRAIAAFKYDQEAGAFRAAVTPVVAEIVGANGITATESATSPGVWTIGYLSEGVTGYVDSIEPINARLEFRGLTSYLKLPAPSNTKFGLIGKIILPKGYISGKALRLVFHLFGDASLADSTANKVSFEFDYSSVFSTGTSNTLVTANTYPLPASTVGFTLPNTYTAFTSQKISAAGFTIPGEFIKEDAVINFRIIRTLPTGSVNESYSGNIGLIGTYWEIPNNI
jgi:hypothetical protein